ncbi:MAG TPA: PfkB family carbohydrate kinase [Baekduia sp.]
MPTKVLVVGPIARDVTLLVDELPEDGASVLARDAVVAAGGKGGNPASAIAALGVPVALLGAVGDDAHGDAVLAELDERGVDVSAVKRLPGAATAHIVHLVQPHGHRRYVEHPAANTSVELTAPDIQAHTSANPYTLVSTALPLAAARTAASCSRAVGATVIVDASGSPETVRAVLPDTTILRCDADEAAAFTGRTPEDFESAEAIATELLAAGPRIVVVASAVGDLVARRNGPSLRLPHLPVELVDPTGGGDAFAGTLAAALAEGRPLEHAARLASAAAADTVARLGGRPRFDRASLLRRLDAAVR